MDGFVRRESRDNVMYVRLTIGDEDNAGGVVQAESMELMELCLLLWSPQLELGYTFLVQNEKDMSFGKGLTQSSHYSFIHDKI